LLPALCRWRPLFRDTFQGRQRRCGQGARSIAWTGSAPEGALEEHSDNIAMKRAFVRSIRKKLFALIWTSALLLLSRYLLDKSDKSSAGSRRGYPVPLTDPRRRPTATPVSLTASGCVFMDFFFLSPSRALQFVGCRRNRRHRPRPAAAGPALARRRREPQATVGPAVLAKLLQVKNQVVESEYPSMCVHRMP
jgi:hypothetical protein